MKLSNTVIKPIVTEKTTLLNEENKYVFRTDMKGTKYSIAKILQELYKVDAIDIKTIIVKGKVKRIGKTRNFTRLQNWKKAVVTLKKGQKIENIVKGTQK